MTNIYSIFTKQPLTQDNDTGAQYFRVTSHSKPDTVSARRKREILKSLGWSEYRGETIVVYSHPDVSDNTPHFLDNAWEAQVEREFNQRRQS